MSLSACLSAPLSLSLSLSHCAPLPVSLPLSYRRSLVEDDDPHMKVSLGCGDMGVSAHLQASKTGNTRFFTSNTHSSVVLQVRSPPTPSLVPFLLVRPREAEPFCCTADLC